MMRKNKKRIALARRLILLLCLTGLVSGMLMPGTAGAGEMPDPDRIGSISITFKEPDTQKPVEGLEVNLYRVAHVIEEDGFKFGYEPAFAGASKVPETDSDLNKELANELAGIAADVTPSAEGKTNAEGNVAFADTQAGLYLAVPVNKDGSTYFVSPFLVTVPVKEPDGSLKYEVDASPKPEVRLYEPVDTPVTLEKIVRNTSNNEVMEQIPSGDYFDFTLSGYEADYPLPDGGSVDADGNVTVRLQGVGTASFGTIQFTKPGDYYYAVEEVRDGYTYADSSRYNYSSQKYWVHFRVDASDDGRTLAITTSEVKQDGPEGTPVSGMVLEFTNTYTEPPTPTPEPPTPTPEPPTPTPTPTEEPPTPTPTEEPPTPTPTEEPTPTPTPTYLPDPSGSVTETPTPRPTKTPTPTEPGGSSGGGGGGGGGGSSRLPQTGQLWWPVWVLCAVAVVLILSGALIRKKRK